MVFEGKKLAIASLMFMLSMLVVAGFTGVQVADANQCAAQCYAAEQACMQSRKGSPSCSSELTSCLQACRAGR